MHKEKDYEKSEKRKIEVELFKVRDKLKSTQAHYGKARQTNVTNQKADAKGNNGKNKRAIKTEGSGQMRNKGNFFLRLDLFISSF